MAQIRVKSYVQIRGKAYRCTACNQVNERKRTISHIYKDHVPLDRNPYYCRLCLFRSTTQEELENHVHEKVFPLHKQKLAEFEAALGQKVDPTQFLMESLNAYHPREGVDYTVLSTKDSEEIWRQRSRNSRPSTSPSLAVFQELPIARPLNTLSVPTSSCPAVLPSASFFDPLLSASRLLPSSLPSAVPASQLSVCSSLPKPNLHSSSSSIPSIHLPASSSHSSERPSQLMSPPPVQRFALTENVLDSILGSFNPDEPISTPPTPQLVLPATATTTATAASVSLPTTTSSDAATCTSPVQKLHLTDTSMADAINAMTHSICKAIDRQTEQFSMLRATLTTFLRRMEDRENRPPTSYSPTPGPAQKRQLDSVVYVPTKKRKTHPH